MRRTTIDFGIDLGTTNSTIAVIDRNDAKVIPNKVGSGITPSAIWFDKRGNLHVGEEAKFRLFTDKDGNENGSVEFKQMMGLKAAESGKTLQRSGRVWLPEELSAEVLKNLRTDVRSNMGEDVQAAVITVPAAFDNSATAATTRAAKLAGIALSPLLLEPVAASLAYGFQSEKDNVYWLIYDFGGGTFDAAVMRIRDGLIHVENHDGDNQLGGKLLDWDLVTEHLAPAAAAQFDLPDFTRGNQKWKAAFGRMKWGAEKAKIEVCRTRAEVDIDVDDMCEDAKGRSVDFHFRLTPAHVEAVTRPYIARTLNLCRKTLRDAQLPASAMERVIMVGGSTLNPWIRDAIQAEMGRPLEFGIDPVTVVARGAAIFASTLDLKNVTSGKPVAPGVWTIETEHKQAGNVQDPDVGGRVVPPAGANVAGYSIEFFDGATKWRSGRIALGPDGVFMTQFYAATHGRHDFGVELCDPTGTPVPTDPQTVPYTFMINVPTAPPAAHTYSIGLANGDVAIYVKKGTELPTQKATHDHLSTIPLRAGRREDVLRIPLLEGEHNRARRNHLIGEMVISGADISRDLPEGSEIEIAVDIDLNSNVSVEAYIPRVDETINVRFDSFAQGGTLERLIPETDSLKQRLEKARAASARGDSPGTLVILARIDNEDLMGAIRKLIAGAANDPGSILALDRRLRELASLLDDLDDALEWPKLLEAAKESRRDAERVVEKYGKDDDKRELRKLQAEFQRAVDANDADMLRRNTQDFDALWSVVVDREPGYHIGHFEHLITLRDTMTDKAQADQVIAQGRRAIRNNDIDGVKAANRQLRALLPGVQDPRRHVNEGDTVVIPKF